jgi:hypothetical protein
MDRGQSACAISSSGPQETMSIRAALLLALTLNACTPSSPPPKAPETPAAPAADAAPDKPDAAASADQGAAQANNTIGPPPEPEAPKEPDSPDLPFEDPAVADGVVWLNLYPGYSKKSTITVKHKEINTDNPNPEFKLYATTDTNSNVIGTVKYAHSEQVRWRKTRVIVEEARPFVAEQNVTLTELRLAKPEIPDVGEAVPNIKMKKGEKLMLYFFGEPPNCYMGLPDGPMLYGPCPEAPQFSNPTKPESYIMAPLEPERHTWWLLVQRGDKVGWMQVDRRSFSHDPKY